MNYTWDIKDIKKHKTSAFFNGDKEAYIFYKTLIDQFYNRKVKDDLPPKIRFKMLVDEYNYFNDLFKTDLFDEIISLYNLVNDENVFNDVKMEQDTIDMRTTINHTSQFLKNILSAQDYNKIKNIFLPDKHILNLTKIPSRSDSYGYCGGTTYYAPDEVKYYINLVETNTYMDLEGLIHESMHSLIYQLYYDKLITNKTNDIFFLREIEGCYASMLANEYIKENLNEIEALKLIKQNVNDIFTSSYLLYLYNTLFITRDENKFNLIEMNNKIKDEMNIDEEIDAETVIEILTSNPFEIYGNILSYLISLNVFTNIPDPKEGLEAIKKFKKMDNSKIQDNISHKLIEESIVLLEKEYQKTLHIK